MPSKAIAGYHPAVQDLVRALGKDPDNVKSFVFDASYDDVLVILTEEYPSEDDVNRMTEVVKRYHLVLQEEEPNDEEVDNG